MLQRKQIENLEFAYLEQGRPENGRDAALVVCLHGFPDTAYSFVPVLSRLAAAGYHAIAPFMPGYLPGGLADDGDYRITTTAERLATLIATFTSKRVYLVGHDWGAVATYILSSRHPQRIAAAVTAAVPHLRRFLLQPTLHQLYRSRYMAFFQLRSIPERRIVAGDFAWLRQLIGEWSPGWTYTEADIAPLKVGFSQTQHLAAALAYYRSLPGVLADRRNWPSLLQPLQVPTKVIYGADDGCIGPEMFQKQERWFSGDFELVRVDGAGHFMQCEQPDRFADEVLAFLSTHPI